MTGPAVSESFQLHSGMDGIEIGRSLEYFEDESGSLTIDDIRSKITQDKWEKSESDVPGFGFSDSVIWFRWTITSEEERRYYLELTYPVVDYIDLYQVSEDGTLKHTRTGDMLPFSSRDLDYRNAVFLLDQPAGKQTQFYLRIQTSSTFIVPLQVWSPQNFAVRAVRDNALLGIFYGAMLVMLLYNLVIFVSVKDISYLFYVLYISFWTLFLATFNGLAFQILWPDSVWWANNSLNFFAFVTLLFMQLFTITFLNVKKFMPVLFKILFTMVILSAIGTVVSLLIPYRIGIRIVSLHAILTVLLIMTTAIRSFLTGYKPARFFLVAWSAMLIGLLVLTLRNFAILPDNMITRWSSQAGSALEVVFLALGLADRINVLKQEKLETERKAVQGKLQLLNAFARFVPDQFLKILGRESIEEIKHGDSIEKQMAVLFTDIRNFTKLSEGMNSRDNFRFLNSYLKKMGPVILNHNGFIDKFIGDAIMALFPEDPSDAVRCAIEMRQKLREFNEVRQEKGYEPVEMGIGIHYGPTMLGTVGSEVRLETTVIGDTVNYSSRLESLTKVYKSNILISESLYHSVKNHLSVHYRLVDHVLIRGKSDAGKIYEIFDEDPPELFTKKKEYMELFRQGLNAYRTGAFEEAAGVFKNYCDKVPGDPLGRLYQERCEKIREKPPKNWNGIVRIR